MLPNRSHWLPPPQALPAVYISLPYGLRMSRAAGLQTYRCSNAAGVRNFLVFSDRARGEPAGRGDGLQ